MNGCASERLVSFDRLAVIKRARVSHVSDV